MHSDVKPRRPMASSEPSPGGVRWRLENCVPPRDAASTVAGAAELGPPLGLGHQPSSQGLTVHLAAVAAASSAFTAATLQCSPERTASIVASAVFMASKLAAPAALYAAPACLPVDHHHMRTQAPTHHKHYQQQLQSKRHQRRSSSLPVFLQSRDWGQAVRGPPAQCEALSRPREASTSDPHRALSARQLSPSSHEVTVAASAPTAVAAANSAQYISKHYEVGSPKEVTTPCSSKGLHSQSGVVGCGAGRGTGPTRRVGSSVVQNPDEVLLPRPFHQQVPVIDSVWHNQSSGPQPSSVSVRGTITSGPKSQAPYLSSPCGHQDQGHRGACEPSGASSPEPSSRGPSEVAGTSTRSASRGALCSSELGHTVHVHDSIQGLPLPPTLGAIGSGPREHGSSRDHGFVKVNGTFAAPRPPAGIIAVGKIPASAHYIGDKNPWADLQDSDSDSLSSLYEDSFQQVSSSHLPPTPALKGRATSRRISRAALKVINEKRRCLIHEYFYSWLLCSYKANKAKRGKEAQCEFLSRTFVSLGHR